MLKLDFPKSLRQYPEGSARETYIYRVVRRGLPRVFYKEYEHSREAGRQVKFRFADLVMYFAQAAAQGVIGNLAYYAIAKAIKALRKPKPRSHGQRLAIRSRNLAPDLQSPPSRTTSPYQSPAHFHF